MSQVFKYFSTNYTEYYTCLCSSAVHYMLHIKMWWGEILGRKFRIGVAKWCGVIQSMVGAKGRAKVKIWWGESENLVGRKKISSRYARFYFLPHQTKNAFYATATVK